MKNYLVARVVSILTVVLLSLSLFVVAASAQYSSQATANVTIGSNGAGHVDQSSSGGMVSIDIAGTPGTKGSVSLATYSGNPQPTASVPDNTKLIDFTVITINMPEGDFFGANIVFHYNDSNVAGISSPYLLYKYIPASNSYILQNAFVDTNAKTITLSISSLTDPLFAIGGASSATTTSPGVPALAWVLIAVIIAFAVFLVVLIVNRRRKSPFEVLVP
jgi:hypothetical protein